MRHLDACAVAVAVVAIALVAIALVDKVFAGQTAVEAGSCEVEEVEVEGR